VKVGPRNFYTSPGKKGKVGKQTSFTPQPAHMPDDYDYAREMARKEMAEGKAHEQEKPFSQAAKQRYVFSTNKDIYDIRPDIPAKKPRRESPPPMEQEVSWKPAKPSRKGHSCTLGKTPEYIPDPIKFTQRRRTLDGDAEAPPAFKRPKAFQSRPSPSVMCNAKNIKASFPSIFRR